MRWIFCALLVAYVYFYQGGGWNQNSRFDLVRALVDDGSVIIDRYAANTDDRATCAGGHTCSDKAPGLALVAVPVVAVASLATTGLVARSYVATALTCGLAVAAAGALVFWICVRLGAGRRGAALIALAFGLGTPMWCYATLFTGHALAVALLVATLAAAMKLRERAAGGRALAVLVGLAAGWTTITEFPAAVPAAILCVFAVFGAASTWRVRLARALWIGAGGAVAAVALAAYNLAAFGAVFHLGYQGVSERFPGMQQGLFGIGVPDLRVLVQILVGHYRGLWFFAPVLALGLGGFGLLIRRRETRALGCVLLALAAYAILLDASYAYWDGGSSYGPRHAAAANAWLALGLAPLWARGGGWLRGAIVGLAVVGMCCAAIAVTTDAQPMIDNHHPMGTILWPAFSSGRMAINTQSFDQLRPQRAIVAWNVGQQLGLRGWASLLPLIAAWLAIAVRAAWRPWPQAIAWPRVRIDRARARAACAAVAPAAAIAVAVAVVCWRGWNIAAAQSDLKLQLDQLTALHLPGWNPYDRLGYPFFADGRAGTLYPVQWVALAIGAILDDAPGWLAALKTCAHLELLGLGVYCLARGPGGARAARVPATVGAVVAVVLAGDPVGGGLGTAFGWSVAWLPWLLVALERRRGFGAALAAAMMVLAGGPVALVLGALAIVPWAIRAVVRAAPASRGVPGRRAAESTARAAGGERMRGLLATAAAGALAAALVAPQLVASGFDRWCDLGPRAHDAWAALAIAAIAAAGRRVSLPAVLAIVGGALAFALDARMVAIVAPLVGVVAAEVAGAHRVARFGLALAALALALVHLRAPDPLGASNARVARQAGVPLVYRVASVAGGTRQHLRDFAGGDPQDPYVPARYARLRDAVAIAPAHLAHANVGFAAELPATGDHANLAWRPAQQVWSVTQPAQAVTWYDTATVAPDAPSALARILAAPAGTIATVEPPADPARAARVDAPRQPTAIGRILQLEPDRLVAKLVAPGDGLVVIDELYDPHWRAFVDGRETPIYPAQGFARGLFVAAGPHELVLAFDLPIGYQVAVGLELAALAGALAAWLWLRRRVPTPGCTR